MATAPEERCYASILKVINPYEGTAFVAASGIAVSTVHAVVRDEDDPYNPEDRAVLLEYYHNSRSEPLRVSGEYLPEQSDPKHDVAVLKLDLRHVDLVIPPLPLSLDYHPKDEVIAVGFPQGDVFPERVPGVIKEFHYLDPVTFVIESSKGLEHWTCPVLHIDTAGKGLFGDTLVNRGMSGGPIWSVRTRSVIGVVEGCRPRRLLQSDITFCPEGYGITLDFLKRCSTLLRPHIVECKMKIRRPSPIVTWAAAFLSVAGLAVTLWFLWPRADSIRSLLSDPKLREQVIQRLLQDQDFVEQLKRILLTNVVGNPGGDGGAP